MESWRCGCLEQEPGEEQRDAAQGAEDNHLLRAGRVGGSGRGSRAGAGGGTSGGVRGGGRGAGGTVETLGVPLYMRTCREEESNVSVR